MSTISFHTDITTSISHNNRINIYGNKDINLDKLKENIYYIQTDIKELYKSEFDDIVNEYNSNQKRNDRKIDNYYKKILHDKKTEHQRELIVSIGTKHENISEYILNNKKDILDEYMRNFQKRNPNLKVYNAAMHLDEANPHLHINFVPIAHYTKGLKKRVAYEKALKEQGVSFEQWRERETSFIEDLMHKKGIERTFEGSHKHMTVKEYKKLKEEINSLNDLKKNLNRSIDLSKKELRKIQVYSKCLSGDFTDIYVETEFSTFKDIEEGSIYKIDVYEEIINLISDVESNNKKVGWTKVNIFNDLKNRVDLASINFYFGEGHENILFKQQFLKGINPFIKISVDKINDLSKNISTKSKNFDIDM